MPYCKPSETGMQSSTRQIQRRLGRLLDALVNEITPYNVDGDLPKELSTFRQTIISKLQAEGWSFSYDGGDKMKVRPPGHKNPFPRHC